MSYKQILMKHEQNKDSARFENNLEHIKAIFFDAGNTLLRPYPSVEKVCEEILKKHDFEFDEDKLPAAVAAGDKYYEELYWKDDTFWASEEKAKSMWVDVYSLVAAELGINGEREKFALEVYEEFGFHHRWQLFEEVEYVLKSLKAQDYFLGIISNWDTRLTDICNNLGISKYLDFIISSASVGYLKPQPQIFELGLKRVGIEAYQTMHVGDHYFADVLGAHSAGIKPVLIDRNSSQTNYDNGNSFKDCYHVKNLCSLFELL